MFNQIMLNSALVLALGVVAVDAQAATLNNGDILIINPGVESTSPASATVSWFAFDTSADSKIQNAEKQALTQGTNGIVIGAVTTAGAYGSGSPQPMDTGSVVHSWVFLGNKGTNFNTIGITGDSTNGLDLSGWKMAWSNVPVIDMGGGAWTPLNGAAAGVPTSGYANGKALFSWDGVYGHAYTLDYSATVPITDLAIPGERYFLHLEGAVISAPVPVPAAAWLLGSGLVGLVGVARRRKIPA